MTHPHEDDAQVQVRAEARAHKRERILETATRLFYEGGYRATSMESIADELSATKPFIYYHFKNKYDILEEIALRVIRKANEALASAHREGGSPAQVLEIMVRNYADLVMGEQRLIAVFWREESNFNDQTRDKVLDEQRKLGGSLVAVIEQGVDAGVFKVENSRLTALSIINLLTFTYTWYREGGHTPRQQITDHFVQMVFRIVGAGSDGLTRG